MEPVEITTERLLLRPWAPTDADAVLVACTDPETQRWTTVPSPYTAEHAKGYVEEHAPAGWAAGTVLTFAVCDGTSGEVLASVALRTALHDSWDVGYWATPAARGKGVVSEALRALCRWGFAELGAPRIEWYAEVGNWASRRVAEKAGFTVEGVLRAGLPSRTGRADAWVGARLPTDPDGDTRALPPVPVLSDGVITLRRLRSSDDEDIVRGYDDEERARWLPGPFPYAVEDAHVFLRAVEPEPYDGTGVPLAITLDDDRLVGIVHLHLAQRKHGIGEVGYWVAPTVRGRGVAPRAAALLARWGIDVLALNRVELLADVDNTASQRAAEKGGFLREGVSRAARPDRTGTPRDMVLYAVTR